MNKITIIILVLLVLAGCSSAPKTGCNIVTGECYGDVKQETANNPVQTPNETKTENVI